MCSVLAIQRGERCYLWRYQFQAHPGLRRHQILLHSPSAGIGKSLCKFIFFWCFWTHTKLRLTLQSLNTHSVSQCLLWSFNSSLVSGCVSPLISLCRLKRLVRFYISTTPPGLTLGFHSLLPPSLTSCSRCESQVAWIRNMDQWWCTAAPASAALGPSVL